MTPVVGVFPVMCPCEESGAGLAPACWPDQKPVHPCGGVTRQSPAARGSHPQTGDRVLSPQPGLEVSADACRSAGLQPGVGPRLAVQVVLSWSHHGRVVSEAAVARLAGCRPDPRLLRPNDPLPPRPQRRPPTQPSAPSDPRHPQTDPPAHDRLQAAPPLTAPTRNYRTLMPPVRAERQKPALPL